MLHAATEMREELQGMLVSIQPYARWHIQPLQESVNRYFAILEITSGMERCERSCTSLNNTSGSLAGFMTASVDSRTAYSYNRASFELRGDIEDLMVVLGSVALGEDALTASAGPVSATSLRVIVKTNSVVSRGFQSMIRS